MYVRLNEAWHEGATTRVDHGGIVRQQQPKFVFGADRSNALTLNEYGFRTWALSMRVRKFPTNSVDATMLPSARCRLGNFLEL
jgi:hypothetical protein